MAERKKPLRWRRQPSETGLRAIGQGPRGWDLRQGGQTLGYVRPQTDSGFGWSANIVGYYFVAHVPGTPAHNCLWDKTRFGTEEEAKEACLTYVKEKLRDAERV